MTVVWQTANTLTVTYFNFKATTLYTGAIEGSTLSINVRPKIV